MEFSAKISRVSLASPSSSPTYARASAAGAGGGATANTPAALSGAVATTSARPAPPPTSRTTSPSRREPRASFFSSAAAAPVAFSVWNTTPPRAPPLLPRASGGSAGSGTAPSDTPELRWYAATRAEVDVDADATYRNGPCAASAFVMRAGSAKAAESSAKPRRHPTCRVRRFSSSLVAPLRAGEASNPRSPGDRHSTFPRSVTASSSCDGS